VAQDGGALDVEHRELPLVEREGLAGAGGVPCPLTVVSVLRTACD
jgi:hypothetical protein